jgi:hypothetical protein
MRGRGVVSEIPSDDTTPAPTSDCRIGSELDSPTAHQELDTNIDRPAVEKSYTQPCDGNDPTIKEDPVRFLQDFRGEEPWTLVAIRKIPNHVQAKTFVATPDRDKSAADWVLNLNGRNYDIYFAVNPLKRPMSKKAGKEDVASAEWLWVDLDPRKGAELIPERQEMLALLTDRRPQGLPEPTWIIDSGRGYWAFWKLRTPQPVDGDGPRTTSVENYGRGIERAFPGRGDDCRNIDRVARLPGTINQRTGRRAGVVAHRPENVYELADFPRVEAPAGGGPAANSQKNRPNGEPSLCRPAEVDVAKLPVSEAIKHLIRTGKDPNNPDRYKSRSEAVFAVLLAMAGAGCDDVMLAAVMLDPGLEIGAHIRDQAAPSKYLERQIRKARDAIANPPRRPATGARATAQTGRRVEVNSRRGQTLLNSQRKELRLLHYLRRINLPFDTWASKSGIDLGALYDPAELGVLVEFTVEEDGRFATDPIGRTEKRYFRKGRPVVSPATQFPKRLIPAGFTKEQAKERRKVFNRPKRAAAERRRKAEARAARELRLQQAADLSCRKSAIFTVLSDQWMTIRDIAEALAKSPAFMTPDRSAPGQAGKE